MSLLHSEILCKWKCSNCMRYFVMIRLWVSLSHLRGDLFSVLVLYPSTHLLDALLARSGSGIPPQLLRVPLWFSQPQHTHSACAAFSRSQGCWFNTSRCLCCPSTHRNTSSAVLFVCTHKLRALFGSLYFYLAPYDQIHTGCGLHTPRDKGFIRAWRDVLAASC